MIRVVRLLLLTVAVSGLSFDAHAHGLEAFAITYTVLGVAIGVVCGGITAWRDWHPVRGFLAALVIFAIAATLPDVGNSPGLLSLLGGLALAPLIGLIPVAAGYLLGRRVGSLAGRRRPHRSRIVGP